jgi:hypothetical protein
MKLATRPATLARHQARIQARHDLWQMMARYARGIDEPREEELATILTEDVGLQPQPWTQRPLVGKVGALQALRHYRRAVQGPRHCIANQQLASNDEGTASGYALWLVVQSREEQSYCGWGSYA